MDILFQDSQILVVDKPAGLAVLPEGWERSAPYLLKLLEAEYGKLWVVHRLDKVTSGAMVFARTAEAHRALNRQFELHRAEKAYLAIAAGSPPWNEKIARHPLRVNAGHKHRTAVDSRSGKPSETRFRIIQRYQAHVLLEAQPVTGRTHQVRAHAAALGYPLLGDVLYGAPETDLIARPALHARSLTLQIPEDQNWTLDAHRSRPSTFTAPLPDDFEIALTRISNID